MEASATGWRLRPEPGPSRVRGPEVTRDNRGPSRTLIQQITGRLARSVANRPVAYNDGLLGGSHRWHGEPCSRRGQSFLIKPVKAATTAVVPCWPTSPGSPDVSRS